MCEVAQKTPFWEAECAFWKENLHVAPLLIRYDYSTQRNIGSLKAKWLITIEYWRLEKQPGYKEKMTPGALKKVQLLWKGAVARFGLD